MKDMLFALLAVVAALVAGYFLYSFQNAAGSANSTSLIFGVVFALVAVIFGGLFIFGRLSRHDDIHITE